jgi:hypothetical protein
MYATWGCERDCSKKTANHLLRRLRGFLEWVLQRRQKHFLLLSSMIELNISRVWAVTSSRYVGFLLRKLYTGEHASDVLVYENGIPQHKRNKRTSRLSYHFLHSTVMLKAKYLTWHCTHNVSNFKDSACAKKSWIKFQLVRRWKDSPWGFWVHMVAETRQIDLKTKSDTRHQNSLLQQDSTCKF